MRMLPRTLTLNLFMISPLTCEGREGAFCSRGLVYQRISYFLVWDLSMVPTVWTWNVIIIRIRERSRFCTSVWVISFTLLHLFRDPIADMAYQIPFNSSYCGYLSKIDVCCFLMQLAALWPSGVMDTDGIKRAIYKAKHRRRALNGRRKVYEWISSIFSLIYTFSVFVIFFLNQTFFFSGSRED